ncbi:hypothetical protein AK812_SmicGene25264 [Symbiodinium microadriaticum]|uniref:Uncharacterized protein n=1 Tax=Symbiodinium microadriaticum TaxID=2951 RepID=A0A1Q9DCE1_SYMMI|nr:hypothetical protein AK812_SmicGene25264 [Symbiodinium microadriaticum]
MWVPAGIKLFVDGNQVETVLVEVAHFEPVTLTVRAGDPQSQIQVPIQRLKFDPSQWVYENGDPDGAPNDPNLLYTNFGHQALHRQLVANADEFCQVHLPGDQAGEWFARRAKLVRANNTRSMHMEVAGTIQQ